MAQREPGKARKRAVKVAVPACPAPVLTASPARAARSGEIRALEAERDALKAELDAAKARIAELERSREQVLNRIDWVIDSLHNLTNE